MQQTIIAWFVFFGGFAAEMGVDHILRIQDEDIRTGGIPEPLWFLIQIVLAALALWFAYRGTAPFRVFWKRALVVSVQATIGFFLYVWVGLYYVVGTGIDSL
jgi:hypothetical protein